MVWFDKLTDIRFSLLKQCLELLFALLSTFVCLVLQCQPKVFSCSTQLSMKFIMLINVKMATIVGILTFIRMINTTSESLKVRSLFFSILVFMSHRNLLLSGVALAWSVTIS